MAKNGTITFFSVGRSARQSGGGAFRDIRLPSGETARVMSKRVFDGAVRKADKALDKGLRTRKMHKA